MSEWVIENTSEDREILPEGVYIAVVRMVVDLGIQNGRYGEKRQMWIKFEIPEKRRQWSVNGEEHDKPWEIGRFCNASMYEKAWLRRSVESIYGRKISNIEAKSFRPGELLGKGCQIQVEHQTKEGGKIFARIKNIMPLSASSPTPVAESKLISYSPNFHDDDDWNELPEFIQNIIARSKQADNKAENEDDDEKGKPDFDDAIPF